MRKFLAAFISIVSVGCSQLNPQSMQTIPASQSTSDASSTSASSLSTNSSATPAPASAVGVGVLLAPAPAPVARSSSAANEKICATKSLSGLDVSNYDPSTNWTTVEHAGYGFAYIKASEGLSVGNSLFAGDWKSTKADKILRGAYHFFHPSDDPTKQAQFFLKTLGTPQAGDLPPMLDWEVSDGVSAAKQIKNALIFLQLVEAATGKVPVIYVDPSFWNALGNPAGFVRYPLFIANYNVACPQVPPPWSTWTFWQAKIGPISGVTSADADVDEYNGTLAQLTQFANTGVRIGE